MGKTNLRLSGFGGQGIIMASVVLAKAAVEQDNIYATQTQSYGAESRGGVCMADIIFADNPIDYPKTEKLDILVSMSQESMNKYAGMLLPTGRLVVDSDLVLHIPEEVKGRVDRVPVTRTAEEVLGKKIVANMMMLGALTELTKPVSIDGLKAAISSTFPQKIVELNHRAVDEGVKLAKQAQEAQS